MYIAIYNLSDYFVRQTTMSFFLFKLKYTVKLLCCSNFQKRATIFLDLWACPSQKPNRNLENLGLCMFFSRHKQKNCLSPQYVYWSSKRNATKQIDLRSKCDGRQTQDCQLQWYERKVARHLQKGKVKWSSMSRTSTGTQCLGAAAKSEFNSNKSIAKIWIKESGTKFFLFPIEPKTPSKNSKESW